MLAAAANQRSVIEILKLKPVLFWSQTCVNDYSHSFLCVADGAASQQQVVFVKCISSATSMDSVRLGKVEKKKKKCWSKNVGKQRQRQNDHCGLHSGEKH